MREQCYAANPGQNDDSEDDLPGDPSGTISAAFILRSRKHKFDSSIEKQKICDNSGKWSCLYDGL